MAFQLGRAIGVIDIVTKDMDKGAREVRRKSKAMSQDVTGAFGAIGQAIDGASDRLLAFSAVAGAGLLAASRAGFKAADNIQVLTKQYEELQGGAEAARETMAQIAEAATAVGLPVRRTQSAFAGLIPTIQQSGEDFEDYLNLASRLSAVNPTEGIEGSVFAIREALVSVLDGGSDFISLSERFNIPRKQLQQLVAETGNFSEALDIALNNLGATTALAEARADTVGAALVRLRDEATLLAEDVFLPLLNDAVVALDTISKLIDLVPPGLVRWAGQMTAIAASTAAAAVGFRKIYTLSQALAANETFRAAITSPRLLRQAVGVGAPIVGAQVGVRAVRAVGRRRQQRAGGEGIDERADELAEFEFGDAFEVVKQGAFLLGNIVLDAGEFMEKQLARLNTAWTNLTRTFRSFGNNLKRTMGQVITTIGNIISRLQLPDELTFGLGRLGEATIDLSNISEQLGLGAVGDFGANISGIGETMVTEAETALDGLSERIEPDLQAVEDKYRGIRNGWLNLLFDIEQETETGQNRLARIVGGVSRDVNAGLDAMRSRAAEFVEGLDAQVQLEQELAELRRSGTPEQLGGRIQSLQDERSAIEQLLPSLQSTAAFSTEAAEKLDEYRGRLGDIDNEVEQLAELMPELLKRAKGEVRDELEDTVNEVNAGLEETLGELRSDLDKRLGDARDEFVDRQDDLRDREQEAEDDFLRNREQARQEHRQRIADIERQFDRQATNAIRDLNVTALLDARRQRQDALSEQEQRYEKEREQRKAELERLREDLQEQRDELERDYEQRRQDLIAANRERIAEERAAARQEIAEARQKAQEKLRVLDQEAKLELQIQRQKQAATLNATQTFWDRMVGLAQSAINRVSGGGSSRGGSTSTGGGGSGRGGIGTIGTVGTLPSIAEFANGGRMADRGLAILERGEVVRTPEAARQEERLLRMAADGMAQSVRVDAMNVSINGTNLSEGQLRRAVAEGVERELQDLINR